MKDFTKLLAGGFGNMFETPSAPAQEGMPKLKTPKPKRSVGDVYVALEAQKVYNPDMPSVQKPQAPKNPMLDTGTSHNLGLDQGWGNPSE